MRMYRFVMDRMVFPHWLTNAFEEAASWRRARTGCSDRIAWRARLQRLPRARRVERTPGRTPDTRSNEVVLVAGALAVGSTR
jgi:hypothetical protein